jgi:hypothetical protein
MAILSQEGDKLKIVNGGTRYYNLDDVSYYHNNVMLEVTVNGLVKESLKYTDITLPISTSLDDLVTALNNYTKELSVNVTNSTDVSNVENNTYATKEMVKTLYSQLEDIKDLLKLILS